MISAIPADLEFPSSRKIRVHSTQRKHRMTNLTQSAMLTLGLVAVRDGTSRKTHRMDKVFMSPASANVTGLRYHRKNRRTEMARMNGRKSKIVAAVAIGQVSQ
jgi:hypothetical protein